MRIPTQLILIGALSIAACVIAYLGDVVGSRVGKRRVSLFGLRPRYTGVIISMATGLAILLVSLLVTSVASENVRRALLHFDDLRQQEQKLTRQVAVLNESNSQLRSTRDRLAADRDRLQRDVGRLQEQLGSLETQLHDVNERLTATQRQLLASERQLRSVRGQLSDTEASLARTREALVTSRIAVEEARKELDESSRRLAAAKEAEKQSNIALAAARESRDALILQRDQVEGQLKQARARYEQSRKEFDRALRAKQREIDAKTKAMSAIGEEIERLKTERDKVEKELQTAEKQLHRGEEEALKAAAEVIHLDRERHQLRQELQRLQTIVQEQQVLVEALAEGEVTYRAHEVIASTKLSGGQDPSQVRHELEDLLAEAAAQAEARGARGEDGARAVILPTQEKTLGDQKVYYYEDHLLDFAANDIARLPGDIVVDVVAARNFVRGEQIQAQLRLYPSRRVYDKGDVLLQGTLDGRQPPAKLVPELLQLLQRLRPAALKRGLKPGATGRLGEISWDRVFEVVDAVRKLDSPVRVTIVAARDIWTEGPLDIEFRYEVTDDNTANENSKATAAATAGGDSGHRPRPR